MLCLAFFILRFFKRFLRFLRLGFGTVQHFERLLVVVLLFLENTLVLVELFPCPAFLGLRFLECLDGPFLFCQGKAQITVAFKVLYLEEMPEVKDHGTDRCADIDRSKGRERKLKDAGNDEHAENSCQAVPVFLDDTVTALMDFVEAVPINDNKDAVEAEESRTSQVVIVDVVEIEEPGELRHAEEHKSDGCRRFIEVEPDGRTDSQTNMEIVREFYSKNEHQDIDGNIGRL